METQQPKRLLRLALWFTFFTDLLGYAIAFPVFAPALLDVKSGLFAEHHSLEYRLIVFGLLLGTYAFAQLLGGPLLARLAFARGRRKVLTGAIAVTCLGHLICGYGLLEQNLALVFLGRFLGGFTTGNSPLILSDISTQDPARPGKHHLSLAVAGGLGFIIGPLLTGLLADDTLLEWFHSALPFWIAAGLCLISLILVYAATSNARETEKPLTPTIWQSIYDVRMLLKHTQSFLVLFLFMFGWYLLIQMLPAYFYLQLDFLESEIGFAYAWMGVFWLLAAYFMKFYIEAYRLNRVRLVKNSLIAASVLTVLVIFNTTMSLYVFVLPLLIFACCVIWANSGTLTRIHTEERLQRIVAWHYSVSSVSAVLACGLGGLLLSWHQKLPFIVAAVCFLIAAIIFFVSARQTDSD